MHSPIDRPLSVLFVPGREPDYIRNLVLRQALTRRHQVAIATDSIQPASWRVTKALAKAAWLLRKAPDLVLVGFYGQPLMPAMRALTRRPILFDAYLSTYDTLCFDRQRFRAGSLPGRLAYALDQWACRWADHILLDTQAHRDFFVQTFGVPPAKIDVIYVGCDERHFAPRPAPPPSSTLQVFTYTSFLRLHGVEYVLHAARQVASRSDIVFTIAGSGAHLHEMQRLAQDLGLENVHFPGWLPFAELPEAIAAADLCLGGHFSAVPKAGRVIATKTFQFLSMGKPTIAADSPANREVLIHRRNAYLCPPADGDALAAAILDLYENPALCREIGQGGQELYRSRFTTEAIARDLEAVLDRLLSG